MRSALSLECSADPSLEVERGGVLGDFNLETLEVL